MLKKDKMAEAIEELKNGNVEGFNYIYSETFNFVYSRAKYMLGEEELALDLTQEVYLILYNKIGDLNSSNSLYAWLKTIIFHKGLRLIEKRNKTVLLSEESEDVFDALQDDSVDFEEDIVNQEDVQIIKNCINSLSDEQRLVILAYYYDNMKTHEIAETLNISEGTVKSRLSLARKHLKNMILEQEKKQGYKLHSFGAVTMAFTLGGMLNSNSASTSGVMQMLLPALHTQLGIGTSAVGGVAKSAISVADNIEKNGAKTAKKVLQKAASGGAKKIAVGVATSVAVTVAVGAAVIGLINREEPSQEPTIEAEQTEYVAKSGYEIVYVLKGYTWRNVNGEVSASKEYLYNQEEKKATVIRYSDGEQQDKDEYIFDKNGNIISEKNYGEGDEFWRFIESTYDENGKLTCKTLLFSEDRELKYVYTYDENGKLIGDTGYVNGVVDSWTEYVCDENGNVLYERTEYSDSSPVNCREYTYDENGNMLSKSTYYEDDYYEGNLLKDLIEYTYDENGNLTSDMRHDHYGNFDYHIEYVYDENGNLVSYSRSSYDCFTEKTSTTTYTYTYDENGNRLSEKCLKDGEFYSKYEYVYDDYGNLIQEILYYSENEQGAITDYEYEAVEMAESEKEFYDTYIFEAWKETD